ncbi:Sec-independent protein secretion pathway component [Rubellimicrobium thermophilum DSM 16684]|uniref:Sec-independent protein translocase protein TatA n=1 Tax=Rubellimicrobium thermophilum DSM 16684 TaxID=1123069 RepID=S9SML6_9RHOB|nr:twin-arginine translocase TatA/TatE family subunit [Rubellimicrobium thermophilum]EPX87634.1 Sec-independent protein secretion pathway component [Rubellimicrobium thermophilum DSM 16684]
MLNNIGLPGLLLIAVVVLVLFGRGKIASMMGEVGKGITAFRKGMEDGRREIEEGHAAPAQDVTPVPQVTAQSGTTLHGAQGNQAAPTVPADTTRSQG